MEIIRNLRDSRQVKFVEDTIQATTIKITLTEDEIEQVYRERRLFYNIEDIKSKLEEMIEEYEGVPEEEKLKAKLNDKEWLRNTAKRFDDALSNNDSFMESFWKTADYVINDELEGDE